MSHLDALTMSTCVAVSVLLLSRIFSVSKKFGIPEIDIRHFGDDNDSRRNFWKIGWKFLENLVTEI